MTKNLKKRIKSIALSLAVMATAMAGSTSMTVFASSTSWNFKNSNFKNLGTISSSVTVDGLGLNATGSKTMSVTANSASVNGTSYTYCLRTGGTGNTSYRSVKVPVSSSSTIKVTLKSGSSSTRSLAVADSSGKKLSTISATGTAATKSYKYSGKAGYVYLYSTNSSINIYKIQVDGSDNSGSTSSGSTSGSTTVDTSDGTVVTSYSALVSAVKSAAKNGGGKVYVKGTKISCTGQLALDQSKANVSIIGVANSDGSYPVLDFSAFRKSYIGKASSDAAVGIRITGSNYTISNLIIQKAPDNGIQIKGSSAGNNTIKDCIVRYNNDAGVQITNGAYNNTVRFVYSYRNCDVYTIGGNADGFAPKLKAGSGNTFYGCYAWENSDDGWDSYDKSGQLTTDLSYEECATWNNGDPTIFTGAYDYKNGDALDKDLFLVELIMAKDSSFATNYANKKYQAPTGKFIATEEGTLSLSDWTGSYYAGNPNGFKFGSVNTTKSAVRTVKNCLSFGHAKKGFDNNNSKCTASFTNCVAFDNGYNYYIQPFTLKAFSNAKSFSGKSSDKLPSGFKTTTPSSSEQSSIRSSVNKTVDKITENCKNNKIVEIKFSIY